METFLATLIETQSAQGLEVAALVHAHKPDGPPSRPDPAMPPPWIVRAPCYGRLLYAPVSPSFPLWMEQTLRDFRPDILHFHLPNTSAFWALASPRARKLPWVIHWHSDVVQSNIDRRLPIAYRFYRPFEQTMLRHAKAIVVTSPPYLEASPALRNWRAKCHVVPLGLPTLGTRAQHTSGHAPDQDAQKVGAGGTAVKFAIGAQNTPDQEGWKPDLLRVLAIGRLTYYKGFEVLIHALAKAPFAQAIIVGEGEHRARLEAILAASGAADRITLAGSLPDHQIQALQDSCDVFCLPSLERTEAFGVVLLEAMQRARPVIASNIPGSGVGWVVDDGATGLLFPPGDADALAARLESMAEPETRCQLGRSGHARFERHFRIEQVAEMLDHVYQLAKSSAQ